MERLTLLLLGLLLFLNLSEIQKKFNIELLGIQEYVTMSNFVTMWPVFLTKNNKNNLIFLAFFIFVCGEVQIMEHSMLFL